MRNLMKTGILAATILHAAALPTAASANSLTRASQASATAIGHIVNGSATILRGSGTVLQGGSELVVASATMVGDSVVVILKGASTGAEIVLEATGEGLQKLSQFTGRTLSSVVTSAGTILVEGTKVVLFIPRKTATALFEASRFEGQ